MTFYSKIKELRIDKGLTQEELAKELNVSRQAISKWESGVLPDVNNLVKISEYFDCSMDYLISNKEEKSDLTVKQNNTKSIIAFVIFILAVFILIFIKIISVIFPTPITRQYVDGSWYTGFVGFIDYYNLRGLITILFIFINLSLIYLILHDNFKRIPNKKFDIKKDGFVFLGMLILILFNLFCLYQILFTPYFTMNTSEIFLSTIIIVFGFTTIVIGKKRMEV